VSPSLSGVTRQPTSNWLRDDRHAIALALIFWILVVLMIVPEGFDYTQLEINGAPSSGSFISRMLWLGLLAFALFVVINRAALAWLLVRHLNPFLLLLAALATASVGWSIDPALSLRRIVRMGTVVAACLAFVLMSWHARRLQNVVRPLLTLVLLGSVVFGLVFPDLAIHQETSAELSGAWHGLANHKNSLGALSCVTLILWFHAGLTREVNLPRALAGCALAAACLALSRSSTSMATGAFTLIFLLIALRSPQSLRRYLPHLVVLLVAILLVYALAIVNILPGLNTLIAPITALANKDATLTGRTEIWAILGEHIRQHPLTGTGYGAYWTANPIPGTDSYEFMWRLRSFYPGSAHNGYLEIVNDLGLIGLACLVGYIAIQVRQSLQLLAIDREQATLYLALLFQQVITNLAESHWFSVLSVDFVLMTLTTTALARVLLEKRLRLIFGEPDPAGPPRFPATNPHAFGRSQSFGA
jgi:exopolysaccharide production protein ExoQ